MAYTEVMRVVSSSGSPTRWQRVRSAISRRSHWLGPYNLATIAAGIFGDGTPSSTGVRVSEETALTYSAFWACVNAISTDVASLPLIHYKRASGGGKERYTDSKLYRLLHDEPNSEMTSFTMRQVLTAHALTWGGGYAEIERGGDNKAIGLWPITPDRVTPGRDAGGQVQYRVTNTNRPPSFIPAADMLHIPGLGFNGLQGYSVVAMARESIGLGLATERFGGTFFGNGATFGGVIKYKGPKPPELSEKNAKEVLEGKHKGVDRAHQILALYNGAEYESRGIPPNDAQFLETRLHQVEEMCRWFRMPPHKIQHLLRSTNNNIEHQGIEYYTDTLRPWLVRWEQEINRKLISPSERRIQFAEHLIDGVLRGDLPSRYAAYAIGRQWGWLSADDICDRENMNPLPNGIGKVYLLPMNMTPADRITELIDAQIKAKETPAPAPGTPPAGAPDPNAVQQNALALVENIRIALTEAEQRAELLLTRAVQAEAQATATGELQVEAEQLRAAAATAQQEVGTLQALLIEATTRADQAGAALLAAQADLEARALTQAAELAASRQRDTDASADVARLTAEVAEAQGSLVLEAAARTEAEAAGAAEHAATLQRMTAVIASHRGLVVDAMGRMIRRETEKARRAQTTPEKLRGWIETFYPVHADICRAALLPAMRVHLAWLQSADDPTVVTTALVTSHIDDSIRQLRAVLESEPEDYAMTLETTLRHWELDRADALADVILKEAIDHVRHQG